MHENILYEWSLRQCEGWHIDDILGPLETRVSNLVVGGGCEVTMVCWCCSLTPGMEGGGIVDGARTPSMVSSPERREVCRKGREYLMKGTKHG